MKSRSPGAVDEGKNPHAKTETDPALLGIGHSLEGFRDFFCRFLRNGSTSGHSARQKKLVCLFRELPFLYRSLVEGARAFRARALFVEALLTRTQLFLRLGLTRYDA